MADSKITFKDIEKANSTIKTTNIKGKQYAEVNQRIKAFRMLYPEGFIKTEVIELDTTNGVIVMKAMVGFYDDNGNEHILGTGVAHEWRNKPGAMVNKTSYVENCDTSAIGRALGMIGLGIDVAIASAEEVKYAVAHQEEEQSVTSQNTFKNASQSKKAEYICENCHKPVTDAEGHTVNQIVAATRKKFNDHIFCMDCAHAIKRQMEEKKAQEEADKEKLPFPLEN